MSKITFTDKDLKIAAGDVVAAFSATLPKPDEYEQPFEYSSEFLSRMDVLVKRSKKTDAWTRAAQRAASIIIAFLISGGVWLAVDVDARAAFVSWIREVYEDSFVYRYFADNLQGDLGYYDIKGLKKDTVKTFDKHDETMHVSVYENSAGKITFIYYLMFENRSHTVFNHDEFECVWKSCRVNDLPADLYISNNSNYANEIIWMDEKLGITFGISAHLDEDKLVELAENVYLKNDKE